MALTLDSAKSEAIDAAFGRFLREVEYWPGRVLLEYSLLLHKAWRSILPMLPLGSGISILDVGTGYGLLADELAANLTVDVEGVDIDPHYIEGARLLRDRLRGEGVLSGSGRVEFTEGDICALPFDDARFEFTMVREVYQFVADQEKATRELRRVTKPSGFVCVSDNDDGLYLTYPEPSEAFRRLHQAVVTEQSSYGGDRQVGRKLSTLLSRGGFDILAVTVLPEARHFTSSTDDPERVFLLEQVREARERVVAAGAIGSDEFDELAGRLEAEPPGEQFRFNARVVVVGRKPV